MAHRLAGAGDVGGDGPGEPRHARALDPAGDSRDGLEITVRGNREAGLDDVDAHHVQHVGDLELLLEGHGRARALLAIAQGGVEDQDAVLRGHGVACIAHRSCPWSGRAAFRFGLAREVWSLVPVIP
jgi:hypothetical protein